MPAYQVRIAYLTPYWRSRRYFHDVILADDHAGALAEGHSQLTKRSRGAQIVHLAATLRPDSEHAEAAILCRLETLGWLVDAANPTRR